MTTHRRVCVVGTSGAGKTRFAAELAQRLGVECVELDALYHQAGWVPLPEDQFRARVLASLTADSWVVDGNYSDVRDEIWALADSVVFLDYRRWRVMSRVTRRSLRRVITREELWNGNRESWRSLCALDPQRSVIRWAWTTYDRRRAQYEAACADPRWSGMERVRLRDPRSAEAWLGGVDVR